MTPAKRRNPATAIVFLFGVLACLRAVGQAGIAWPPEALWHALRTPFRLQLVAGLVMILAALIFMLVRQGGRQE